jgi:hypothetical protein
LKRATLRRKWSTTISNTAENLSKAGWSWGCVSGVNCRGRTIFVADVHRGDNWRFIVHADEKLAAFIELESAIRGRVDHTFNIVNAYIIFCEGFRNPRAATGVSNDVVWQRLRAPPVRRGG